MAVFSLLLGASIAATPVAPATPQIDPIQPALWKIEDGDTTVYLFGTFHALDGTTNWFKNRVKSAFESSDQLILEALLPQPAKPEASLHGKGSARLGAAKPPIPLRASSPMAQLAPSGSSFLASTQLVMKASEARGMSIARGADAQLRQAAEGSGMPVAALESFEFQIAMFNSLPGTAATQPQARAQAQETATLKTFSIVLAQLQDAWNRGDLDTFAPMLEQMRQQSPQTYNTMFRQRNVRWAHWIADRMQQPGTVFVAVGAGHLSGPDSVQNQLSAIGVRSMRIN